MRMLTLEVTALSERISLSLAGIGPRNEQVMVLSWVNVIDVPLHVVQAI